MHAHYKLSGCFHVPFMKKVPKIFGNPGEIRTLVAEVLSAQKWVERKS